jgi:glutamyl-tRNA synthetase
MDLATAKENLGHLKTEIENIKEEDWTVEKIELILTTYLKNNNLKIGEYLWPLRVALSGRKQSPGPFEIAFVLGKAERLQRISFAT